MDGYPAPASGSGQFSTNRWNPPPAGLYMAQRVGFSRITVLGFALSLMSLSSQQLVSAAKICWWSLSIDVAGRRQSALASTAAADPVPRSPAACRPPIMSARFIPLMQETLLPHAVLTLDSCHHHLYLNDATSKWMVLAFYWMADQFTVV